MSDDVCVHMSELQTLQKAKAYECDQCVETGDGWVHLRTCQTCGATLCCDSSPNQHMTKHFHATQHPLVISAEPGESWIWCYVDEEYAGY